MIDSPGSVETPSGKGSGDENFPVGSLLLPRRLRPHVAVFYAYARGIEEGLVENEHGFHRGDLVHRSCRVAAPLLRTPRHDQDQGGEYPNYQQFASHVNSSCYGLNRRFSNRLPMRAAVSSSSGLVYRRSPS